MWKELAKIIMSSQGDGKKSLASLAEPQAQIYLSVIKDIVKDILVDILFEMSFIESRTRGSGRNPECRDGLPRPLS